MTASLKINMLHKDMNSSVSLPEETCQRFQIGKGIRQGYSLSPLLFILVTEILTIHLRSSKLQGLNINGKSILVG